MTKKNSLKAIVLSLGLAAMMLPASAMAQENAERPGGLFGLDLFGSEGLFSDSELRNGEQFDSEQFDITNADFGEEAPLGSGIAILLGAGLGYVALKKKEDKQ